MKDLMEPTNVFCTQHQQFADPRGGDYHVYNKGRNRRWVCAACIERKKQREKDQELA